jgi:hypothetical protein
VHYVVLGRGLLAVIDGLDHNGAVLLKTTARRRPENQRCRRRRSAATSGRQERSTRYDRPHLLAHLHLRTLMT